MKLLIVRRTWGRKTTFDERHDEWERLVIEGGALVVIRPDGTKFVFAPGRWTNYETRVVTT